MSGQFRRRSLVSYTPTMVEVQVVRVFTDAKGNFGNPLGVVLDTAGLSDHRRQAIATRLNFSETVFVEDVTQAQIRIFTPAAEIPLAGHPLVGTSWLLSQVSGRPIDTLRPLKAANVETWLEDGVTWIRARIADAPPWRFVQLATPAEVEALPIPPGPAYDLHEFWAWIDEPTGRLRARVFAAQYGISEDEATGSGALRLLTLLPRELQITQGRGSVIYARPGISGRGEIGGRVVKDAARRV
jgi:predicted PhzF superfamily epimerase YddE/YHI9